nr:MAG TPA: protein of unknown function (DUF771) [Caudoviricetes sp.]
MQATLTISSLNHVIVDELTGERWKMIPEEEYTKINKEKERGNTGDMKWFLEKVCMTEKTAKEKILYPFRNELENIVLYSDTKGKPWKFKKTSVSEWLEENWKKYQ